MITGAIYGLLQATGRRYTLLKRTTGAYNTADGSSAVTSASYEFTGKLTNYKSTEVDGVNVIRGDRRLYVSALNFSVEPEVNDEVDGISTSDNEYARIIQVQKIEERETVICYICQVRT